MFGNTLDMFLCEKSRGAGDIHSPIVPRIASGVSERRLSLYRHIVPKRDVLRTQMVVDEEGHRRRVASMRMGRHIVGGHPTQDLLSRGSGALPNGSSRMPPQNLFSRSIKFQWQCIGSGHHIRCSPDRFKNKLSVPLYHQSSRSNGGSLSE